MVAINYSVLFTIQTVLFGGPGANVETDTGVSPLANPGTYADLKCTVDGKSVTIGIDAMNSVHHHFPHPGNDDDRRKYPHQYFNKDKITWGNDRCNKPENGEQPVLLEFPILLDSHNKAIDTLYNYKQLKPRPEPGPCRIVTRKKGDDLCGVMCHIEYWKKNPKSGFKRCT
ncbi:Ribonuclease/ribotoxin [Aspergillus sergii]|uniref:Ribonuclease/ribotoxin n=1 Tax=Aspergillus sergii TaxID=1034303 RepID=A0A5N6XMX8_9EURO|nr:Ribonuclease/ribotoxin [Aspergillus sergii]